MAANDDATSAPEGIDDNAKIKIFATALLNAFGDRASAVVEQQIANATDGSIVEQWRRIAGYLG